jgi:membrane-bound inhibitor of C-type lysozyme
MIVASIAILANGFVASTAFAAEPAKSAKAQAQAKTAPASADADITGATATEYSCEQNNKITIYHHDNDDSHIALRWKKKIHRLERVGTSTGALRFENKTLGLIWIGIPTKGMLLDSKQNRQLANECKNAEQSKPSVAETPASTNG